MIKIDFRSDTVTKPTAGMLDAMMSAKVGDDVFGEDPTVNELEQKLATLFNMEAALFCPSGTMSNQIAIKCFTNPMDEVICDQTAHVYRYEGGGIAYNSLASVRLLNGERGILTPEMIEPEINEDNIHYPNSSLVVLENTVNKGGGKCYKLSDIEPIHHLCAIKNIKLHLDGARVFNALVATGNKAKDYGKYFDGISVCLSKGLGAPVGSVFLSDTNTIKKATRIRKVLGGGMRQAGFLAAAGIYALDHHVDRLAEDHNHAKALAVTLNNANFVSSVMPVETNIVLFDITPNVKVENVVKALANNGVLCNATSNKTIRLVTHLDISAANVDQTIEVITKLNV
ncbi:MAG: threonine aldolase [Pedobacter sp.]|nr:MAG: threonine aldolase [Pedobacter sp.]